MTFRNYNFRMVLWAFSILVSSGASAITCDPDDFSLASPYANYSYGEGYEQYEYSFDYSDAFWTATAFSFASLPNTNPVVEGVTDADSDEAALIKVFLNVKKGLLGNSFADKVSQPSFAETEQGELLTFNARSVAGMQSFSLLVRKGEGGGLVLYRTLSLSDKTNDETRVERVASRGNPPIFSRVQK